MDLLYDERCDIYSFGLLLWQLCSCVARPFNGYTREMHGSLVIGKGARPSIDEDWNPSIKKIIANCWDADISMRPPWTAILETLDFEVEERHASKRNSFFDFSRSKHSIRGSINMSMHSSLGKRHNVPLL